MAKKIMIYLVMFYGHLWSKVIKEQECDLKAQMSILPANANRHFFLQIEWGITPEMKNWQSLKSNLAFLLWSLSLGISYWAETKCGTHDRTDGQTYIMTWVENQKCGGLFCFVAIGEIVDHHFNILFINIEINWTLILMISIIFFQSFLSCRLWYFVLVVWIFPYCKNTLVWCQL